MISKEPVVTKQGMKILHIISSLGDGGAEALLMRLCKADLQNEHIVVSLTTRGKYASILESIGIGVYCLNMTRSFSAIFKIFELRNTIRIVRPDIVQTWMYHADFIGGIAARLASKVPVIWGVHNTSLVIGTSKFTTILICKLNSLLSFFIPSSIIYCADSAKLTHEKIGFCKTKSIVIYNGYDLDHFRPQPIEYARHRTNLGFASSDFVVGMVARFDPMKDHSNFCAAINLTLAVGNQVKVVLVGSGITDSNEELMAILSRFGLRGKVLLLGPRDDVHTLMAAFDLVVLSSIKEAFPNVLAEAMACGVPCVTTNVGDAAGIVGEVGWVVPAGNSILLAEAIESAKVQWTDSVEWSNRKQMARRQIETNFSLRRMSATYIESWNEHLPS